MAGAFGHGLARPTLRDRIAARLSYWRAAKAGLALTPEPRSIGSPERGRALCAGRYHFGGHVVEAGQTGLWSVETGGDAAFEAGRQSFLWMDDLAALGSVAAAARARAWTNGWLDIHGRGAGPGWSAALAGQRLIRLMHHLSWVNGESSPSAANARLSRTLDHHIRFLARRAGASRAGAACFDAICGLAIGALTLNGHEARADAALRMLETACRDAIGADGGIASRNPEELLGLFELLVWTDRALSDRGRLTRPEHQAALERLAQSLRTLRHADGGLARFHGGGRGVPGALEGALALADIRPAPVSGLAMGFARLTRGRTTVIADAGPPPTGPASRTAHAATLAFEMTSARRPVIVNCGAGEAFGAEWSRAARATASQSTLGFDGVSSARFGTDARSREFLMDGPREVLADIDVAPGPASLVAGHDGYSQSHGLIHVRRLDLGTDGRALAGEDVLTAEGDAEKRRFARALDRAAKSGTPGLGYTIRFHLHPDIEARLDPGGRAITLTLRSGEVWIFRHASTARMSLDPSVYLENTRATPLATQQIVLAGRATGPLTAVKWSLAKAQDTPDHLRDLEPDAAE